MKSAPGDPFEARMKARVVESFRGRWSPLGEAFHDPGVALDYVASLEPTHGPTVVRVEATGGSDEERRELGRDWLCEGGRGARPLPRCQPPLLSAWESLDGCAPMEGRSGMRTADMVYLALRFATHKGELRRCILRYAIAVAEAVERAVPSHIPPVRQALAAAASAASAGFPQASAQGLLDASGRCFAWSGSDFVPAAQSAGSVARAAYHICSGLTDEYDPIYVVDAALAAADSEGESLRSELRAIARRELGTLALLRSAAAMSRSWSDTMCPDIRRASAAAREAEEDAAEAATRRRQRA